MEREYNLTYEPEDLVAPSQELDAFEEAWRDIREETVRSVNGDNF